MIFPQLGPEFFDANPDPIKKRMEAAYSEAITINLSFWQEADTNNRYEAGDQTLWQSLYGNLPIAQRKQFQFNMIRPIVNNIHGYQAKNRKSIIITPQQNADNETADQFTDLIMHICDSEGILNTISDAFKGALISGMNLLQVYPDFRGDPISGNIKVDNCAYNTFLTDPFFRKQDLSDCNYIWKRTYMDKRAVISLFPAYTDDLVGMIGNMNASSRDGKFIFMPESYGYSKQNLLTVDEYYYRDFRDQRMLVDTQTGETMEWRGKNEEDLKLYLHTYKMVTVIDQQIPTVRLATLCQGKVLYNDMNPLNIDLYPFAPVFTYYNSQLPYFNLRIQSPVTMLRDTQYLFNRFIINIADTVESQVNSGWVYKENALVNPKDVFTSGNGKGIALKEEAQMTDVQKIPPGEASQSMFRLTEIFQSLFTRQSGVNEEMLGSAVDDKAGVLAMLRQGAGVVSLQGIFDNLDHAQKLLGRIMLEYIQNNFTPGKIKTMLEGKEPTQQFYNKNFGKYNVTVEEGLNTTTQKQMNYAQLLQAREAGIPIPDDVLLEASTIQDKKKLVEAVQKQAQQKQQM